LVTSPTPPSPFITQSLHQLYPILFCSLFFTCFSSASYLQNNYPISQPTSQLASQPTNSST
jgi:hypothetical protein